MANFLEMLSRRLFINFNLVNKTELLCIVDNLELVGIAMNILSHQRTTFILAFVHRFV